MMKVLLSGDVMDGVDLNGEDSQGYTALLVAAFTSNTVVASALIAAGCDLEKKNLDGSTALHLAVRHLNIALIVELLAHGANVNCRDARGLTPMHYTALTIFERSAWTGSATSSLTRLVMAAAKLLLRNGGIADSVDYLGHTPLKCALVYQGYPQ